MFNYFRSANNSTPLNSVRAKITVEVRKNLKSLAKIRVTGITIDSRGIADGSQWNAYAQDFFDRKIIPQLSEAEQIEILSFGLSKICNELIETPVRNECTRMHESGEWDMTVRVVDRFPIEKKTRTIRHSIAPAQISRGLIIRDEPLERILNGQKTWEMRSNHTKIRGTIALIKKGTKAIYGVAEIVDSQGPITREMMLGSINRHGITADRIDHPEVAKYRYAWTLDNVIRLKNPISYQHVGGVIFTSLDTYAIQQLSISLGRH